MEIVEKIKDIAQKNLQDESHFIVDVISKGVTGKAKLLILLDGDEGITIDDCADLSRRVASEIELEDLIEYAYTLEVSSPGLDYPIQLQRQYAKNVGRRLAIKLHSGDEFKGELIGVKKASLKVLKEKKVQKKTELEEVNLLLADIEKAKVLVSFK